MKDNAKTIEERAGEEPSQPVGMEVLPHVGIVAVVGRTNAGKSTLVNLVIGEKISIVSPVVQTTRNVIRGVLTDERGQLVLVDTPGLHKSQSALSTVMNKRARAAAEAVDITLLVVDGAKEPQMEDDGWMRRLVRSETPVVIFLNKSDEGSNLAKFRELWESIKTEKCAVGCAEPVWISGSAKTGEGVEALVGTLFGKLPQGPTLFDENTLSDYPKKLAVADVIREKFFLSLRDELPHSIGVKVDDIIDAPDGSVIVNATVFVQRHNHKGIIIGPKGRSLRAVRRSAAKDLEEFLGSNVSVDIWIKVEKNWDQNFFLLRQMGYM